MVAGDHTKENNPPNENDYSVSLKITMGALSYVVGGDTDGEFESSFGFIYNDIETSVAKRIGGQVDLVTINHHGSKHSSNPFYIDSLNPTVSLISCGTNNS